MGRINDKHPLCKQTSQQQKSAGGHPEPSKRDREDYIRRPLINPECAAAGGEEDKAAACSSSQAALRAFVSKGRGHTPFAGPAPAPRGPINAAESSTASLYQLGGGECIIIVIIITYITAEAGLVMGVRRG